MSLTLGTGPFGRRPAGSFNFDAEVPDGHAIYLERSPREVRGELGGEVVVRSRAVRLLHESGRVPVYYFPVEDVRVDLLEPSDRSGRCPWKGDATYWSVRVGERKAEDAAWRYPRPERAPADLAGLLAFDFAAMDAWYEEEERIPPPHPRDPYHRVDVRRSARRTAVKADGRTVAESPRPWAVFETGMPTRLYLPREDVRMDLLEPTDTVTHCPYKGKATYFRLAAGGGDVAWTFEEPLAEALAIRGALCFADDRVDVAVDG